VIHRGVELAALRVGLAGEIELGQLFVPQSGRGRVDCGEVPVGYLLLDVLLCLLGADEGDADFSLYDLVGVCREVEGWRRGAYLRPTVASLAEVRVLPVQVCVVVELACRAPS
jgi:hypothetical protein